MALAEDKLFAQLRRATGKAIGDFGLIEEGDRILVGVSGGKDSYALLHLLDSLRRRSPISYQLVAANVDSGFPGFRKEVVEAHLVEHGFEYLMEPTNCYEIIETKKRPGTSYCSFCARLRRGVLYSLADRLGCNKIALGHHLDDFIETLLLNQFYAGSIKAMSPKLQADNGRHTVIRPLVYVEEGDIIRFMRQHRLPVICCACPVCGEVTQQRQRMKALIRELSQENPHLKRNMLHALAHVHPRHLLDQRLVDFSLIGKQLQGTDVAE